VPDVVIVRWPEEAAHVERLRVLGTPRLLLVRQGAAAPGSTDCGEDWIRLPAEDADVRLRVSALAARAARHTVRPEVKGDGRLSFRGRWVGLSNTEEALAGVLSERFGEVVDHASVQAAAWRGEQPSSGAVRVHMTRLRKRIQPLGLAVRTVYNRGYVMESRRAPEPR
jgi:DNA-binding response OmpR family regulator